MAGVLRAHSGIARRAVGFFGLLAVLISQPAPAQAASTGVTQVIQLRAQGATARFVSTDATGCMHTSVTLDVSPDGGLIGSETLFLAGTAPQGTQVARLFVDQLDT